MEEKYIILDTETANSIECPLCYDISFAVIDKKGKMYSQFSFVVQEIFCHEKDLMLSCYFADKISMYEQDLQEGKRLLRSIYDIQKTIYQVIKNFDIKAVMAHNAFFDYVALNNTLRYITKSKNRYFLPYKIEIWDTLKMARQVFYTSKDYQTFCKKHSYLNKYQKPQLTAEVLYRYISKNNDFVEVHTGDEDIKIESVIFTECIKFNPEVQKRLFRTEEEKRKLEEELAEKQRKKLLTKSQKKDIIINERG